MAAFHLSEQKTILFSIGLSKHHNDKGSFMTNSTTSKILFGKETVFFLKKKRKESFSESELKFQMSSGFFDL